MGKHSARGNNFALSKGLIAILVASLVALLVLGWIGYNAFIRDDDDQAQRGECVSGDLALPVAASQEGAGRKLIDAYAESNPVVRDYCVRPVYVESINEAAAYVAPDVAVSHQEVKAAGRATTEGQLSPALNDKVGLAGDKDVTADNVEISSVVFPVNDAPDASAVVASQLAENEQAATKALTDQRIPSLDDATKIATQLIATSESANPEGFTFSPLGDAAVVYSVFPLNAAGDVSEEQSRAAQDFAKFSAERFNGNADAQPVIPDLVWAAARPTGGEKITGGADGEGDQKANGEQIMDTLFVLDTSQGTAGVMEGLVANISEGARAVTETGHQVALWNYSSPQSEGVTAGWRNNVELTTDHEAVAGTAGGFTNAGVPQTREVVLAATQRAMSGGTPLRIVIFTSGSADTEAIDDATLIEAMKQAREAGAVIDIFTVGDAAATGAQKDQALEDAADNKGGPNLKWSGQKGTYVSE